MHSWLSRLPFRIVLRRYEAILAASVMLLSGAVIPSSWDPPMETLPVPVIQEKGRPWIALTFDDGPHPVMTEKLLNVLEKEKVPATFFVVGKMAERYPQILERIARSGNEVANHTYHHPRLSRLDDKDIISELAQTRAVIQRITGKDSLLFRPPGGDYTRRTLKVTSQAGYKMVLWSILTKDVQGATADAIENRILRGADDGAIVLMHSGMPHTIAAMPDVISQLRQKGYQFVTVSQILGLQTDTNLKNELESVPIQTASRGRKRAAVRT